MEISHSSDLYILKSYVRAMAERIGFSPLETEEILIAATELGTNILKHAGSGELILTEGTGEYENGIIIEAKDFAGGIEDVELAVSDGFSTGGSLGYGLGTVNRFMDELKIISSPGTGTHVICKRKVRAEKSSVVQCPLEVGVAFRAHPRMEINGDAYIIQKSDDNILIGVIDGLGHGQFAHRAAQKARNYIERHSDQSLEEVFRGVARSCRATRGVVMTLVRIDWKKGIIRIAGIGNVDIKFFGNRNPISFIVHRGVLGMNAPQPRISEHEWDEGMTLFLFSDGIIAHWNSDYISTLLDDSASEISRKILKKYAKENDDATIIVMKGISR